MSSEKIYPFEQIFAAGLTYKKHIEDAGESYDPAVGPPIFVKPARTVLFADTLKAVSLPSDPSILADIELVEPGLGRQLKAHFEGVPKMLDYEAEIGIYFSRDVSADELNSDGLQQAVALFTANDLTLRSVQILGDGKASKLDYWAAAKGFRNFMPVSTPKPFETFSLSQWPKLRVRCWVNGKVRQDESTDDIVYSPRDLFRALLRETGKSEIAAGTALITGTPVGTAMQVSPAKKMLAKFLPNVWKLKLASKSAEKNDRFLKKGDEVVVEVEGVGNHRIRIAE